MLLRAPPPSPRGWAAFPSRATRASPRPALLSSTQPSARGGGASLCRACAREQDGEGGASGAGGRSEGATSQVGRLEESLKTLSNSRKKQLNKKPGWYRKRVGGANLSKSQRAALRDGMARWGWELGFVKDQGIPLVLDPSDLFGAGMEGAPLVIDVGFGEGASLAQLARDRPGSRLLGVEWYKPGLATLLKRVHDEGLGNVRVVRADAAAFLGRHLPPGCASEVLVLFPDPWPVGEGAGGAEEAQRRVVRGETVASLERVLAPGGALHVATDAPEYASWVREVMASRGAEPPRAAGGEERGVGWVDRNDPETGCQRERPGWRPETRYERRALDGESPQGSVIFDLRYTWHPPPAEEEAVVENSSA